jgi:TolB-like protein/Tfp pilus assembly protein PilF
MSSIIPGFEYDIFISYRQKDNRGERWVSEFVESLKTELESTFKEEIGVYFDINPRDGLLETHDVGASLKDKLKCIVFVPIISQTYCDISSFAWQNEFCAFNRLSKEDRFGRDIKISSGNVASRILAVRIHDLDPEDNALLENETGGVFRAVEFIYRSPGVNRPLRAREDHPQDNLSKTYYRDQINKVANAVKEIIYGIKKPGTQPVSESFFLPGNDINYAFKTGRSIIVLPFENMSSAPGQDYLSDGLTEEIITDLSKIPEMVVISRSSAMTFKGARKKVTEIAAEVNVKYVLEGSVRKVGEDLRITVQLIDAISDSHLWAEKYSGKITDIFKMQEKVSGSVVEALKMKFQPAEKKQTSNLKAYDLYLLGRYYWNKRTEEGLGLCIKYFEQAIELDKNYALAYAGLSDAYYVGADWNYLKPEEAYRKSRDLAEKAISLDNRIAEAHATLAGIADNFEYDYEKAETLFKITIKLNPNYATGWQWYADYLVRIGRFEEAYATIGQALKLDPLSPVVNFASGFIFYYGGDYDNALVKFNETLKIDQLFPYLRFLMFLSYFQKGLLREALKEYRYELVKEKEKEEYDNNAERILENEGVNGFLEFIIGLELKNDEPSTRYLAIFYALAGNREKALDYLEFNVTSYISEYQYLNVEPSFTVLHNEPRFLALLKKVGYKT